MACRALYYKYEVGYPLIHSNFDQIWEGELWYRLGKDRPLVARHRFVLENIAASRVLQPRVSNTWKRRRTSPGPTHFNFSTLIIGSARRGYSCHRGRANMRTICSSRAPVITEINFVTDPIASLTWSWGRYWPRWTVSILWHTASDTKNNTGLI